jgi:hypothetical protein
MGKSTKNTSTQSRVFIDKARELGCDEDPKAFKRAFSKIVPPKKPKGSGGDKPRNRRDNLG